ncbi:MAG: butyrate kinase [Clostridia bacterium]|nr:butyrate kinase [Clostridia bacterium]
MTYEIVAINLGSTSTKVSYYRDETCVFSETIPHKAEQIRSFSSIWDQYDFRLEAIKRLLDQKEVDIKRLGAVVTRGGHTIPLEGGTYRINQAMLDMSRSEKYGNHATDLGLLIACALAGEGGGLPLTVDPPTTDEFEPLARYSGLMGISRRSSFHALNHRAVARQYARDTDRDYEKLNLIGIHMGGGITVVAHKRGRMVDANNGILGDGPFSTNRTGTLPTGPVIDMCFSGEYTREQIRRRLNGNGGLMSYLGEMDIRTIEKRIDEGDEKAREALEAMCYQTAKETAAMGAVLSGDVDAIYMTGGVANSARVTGLIRERVSFIAPVVIYPGEFEMQSLALNACEALKDPSRIKQL